MLTVQLENQDPLNPLESNEFAVQLATFSGVEQQVRTNDLLEQMVGGVGGLTEIAKMVGMEVRAAAPATFDGNPITLFPKIPEGSDQAVLVVSDEYGSEVSRMAIPVDNAPIAWGGTDSDGATVGVGTYSFAIETAAEGTPTGRTTPEVYTLVSEVRMENGVPSLVLAGGAIINPDDALAVRIPAPRG